MKCDRCGYETNEPAQLHKVARSFRLGHRMLCADCCRRNEARTAAAAVLIAILLSASIFLLETGGRNRSWLSLNMGLMFALLMPSVVLHELGHVLAAWLQRMRVLRVQIGVGRVLFQRMIHGVEMTWRLMPLSGCVYAVPRRVNGIIRQYSLLIVGGPLANLLAATVCGVAAWLMGDGLFGAAWVRGPAPLHATFLANVILLIESLIPRKAYVTGAETLLDTDGRQLARLLPVWWRLGDAAPEARDLDRRGRLEHAAWLMPHDMLSARQALAALTSELDSAMDASFRATVLSQYAWSCLPFVDDGDFPNGDRCSAEALNLDPGDPTVRGIRGMVLAWSDRAWAGQPLLEMALQDSPGPVDRGVWAAALAHVWWRRGNQTKATEYLALADKLDAGNWLSEAVRRMMQDAASDPVAARTAHGDGLEGADDTKSPGSA